MPVMVTGFAEDYNVKNPMFCMRRTNPIFCISHPSHPLQI